MINLIKINGHPNKCLQSRAFSRFDGFENELRWVDFHLRYVCMSLCVVCATQFATHMTDILEPQGRLKSFKGMFCEKAIRFKLLVLTIFTRLSQIRPLSQLHRNHSTRQRSVRVCVLSGNVHLHFPMHDFKWTMQCKIFFFCTNHMLVGYRAKIKSAYKSWEFQLNLYNQINYDIYSTGLKIDE